MDDATIKAKAKAAKLPRIMWDTPEFRAALATLLESEVAAERERCASVAENYDLGITEGHAIARCIRGA